jgi:hypothetical protein
VSGKPVIEAGQVLAMHSSAVVTQLLLDWNRGNEQARDQMLPLVYDELRRLARAFLARERSDHTLQATALVHEAYLRLIDQRQVDWKNRAHSWRGRGDDATDPSITRAAARRTRRWRAERCRSPGTPSVKPPP